MPARWRLLHFNEYSHQVPECERRIKISLVKNSTRWLRFSRALYYLTAEAPALVLRRLLRNQRRTGAPREAREEN